MIICTLEIRSCFISLNIVDFFFHNKSFVFEYIT